MTESLDRSFGLIIAFLLPGFTCLVGFSAYSATLTQWLSAEPARDPTLGGFMYVALGSLALGLVVSAVRWAIVDTIHHKTGVKKPDLNFQNLTEHITAFQVAVEHNYRYFQFYANMAIAIPVASIAYQAATGRWPLLIWFGMLLLEGILLAASRDCLKRFYDRVSLVLGTRADLDA